jgi:hypothetical protein
MTHMDLSQKDVVHAGSNKSFGFTIAVVSFLVAMWPTTHNDYPRYWMIIISIGFASAAQFRSSILSPLNQAWFKLGLVLHRITNPVIMAALFYGVVTPIAVVFRLMGRDQLGLQYDKRIRSYWVTHPNGHRSDLRKQY